jgi:hypothetical protein
MAASVSAPAIHELLLCSSDETLSSSLALLTELSLGRLLGTKIHEYFNALGNKINEGTWDNKEGDLFQKRVAEKALELNNTSTRGDRLLKLFGILQQLSGTAAHDFRTRFDFGEVADDLCSAAARMLRDDKKNDFTSSDVGSMIEYQIAKLFGGMEIKLEQVSGVQQEKLINDVTKFVQGLPKDQQRFLTQKLGTDDLSEAAIRKAIASGTMWIAFTAAVQFFGFAFYTTAAQLLAIISFHLLPFGAYIGLSSFIAVLASGWMLPIAMVGGIWYIHCKNKNLKQAMVPLVVTTLCLSGMEKQCSDPTLQQRTIDEALSLWKDARAVRDECRAETDEAQTVHNNAKQMLKTTREQLQAERVRDRSLTSELHTKDEELKELTFENVPTIATGAWGEELVLPAKRIQCDLDLLANARRKKEGRSGFWGTIDATMEWWGDSVSINRQIETHKEALKTETLCIWNRDTKLSSPKASEILTSLADLGSQHKKVIETIKQLEQEKGQESSALTEASTVLSQAKLAQIKSESYYFGLGEV